MIIVGERINASRKRIARALDERDAARIEKEARRQWVALNKVMGWDEPHRLRTITSKAAVDEVILDLLKSEDFGTVVMGKRGLSGIKRLLLGSVSAKVLRGLRDQTIYFID